MNFGFWKDLRTDYFAQTREKNLAVLCGKVMLPGDDLRLCRIGEIQQQISAEQDTLFFAGWYIHRSYTTKELQEAELFQLKITAIFEPVGEECGTQFVADSGCPDCGGANSS